MNLVELQLLFLKLLIESTSLKMNPWHLTSQPSEQINLFALALFF